MDSYRLGRPVLPTSLAAMLGGLALVQAAPAAAVSAGAVSADAVSAGIPIPVPRTPTNLPHGIEPLAPYQPQRTCDPRAKPGVLAFAALLERTYPDTRTGGIVRACALGPTSEHKQGRAFDWSIAAADRHQTSEAQALIGWLLAPDRAGHPAAMARRLGLMYIIWDDHIWGTYRIDEGWRPYAGVNAHVDHVHFSFGWAGAEKKTSYWTGQVAPVDPGPPPDPAYTPAPPGPPSILPVAAITVPSGPLQPLLRRGANGPAVRTVQTILRLPATGRYDEVTRAAVVTWQRAHGLVPDGEVGPLTWAALRAAMPVTTAAPVRARPAPSVGQQILRMHSVGAAVQSVQRLLAVPATGTFGPRTRDAVVALQNKHRLVPDGVVGPKTWAVLATVSAQHAAAASATTAPSSALPLLRLHAVGPAVVALQRRLRVRSDGAFGPATREALVNFQHAHHLVPDGVVGPRT